MAQVTQAVPHLDLETVKQRVKLAQSHWERQKWLGRVLKLGKMVENTKN
ncbi:hypothetical protein NIES2109_52940 [Nostoc sp. HK-01]|nr:hypothetical protein NIES2109_52940 [Nostoc sp. HK-01]